MKYRILLLRVILLLLLPLLHLRAAAVTLSLGTGTALSGVYPLNSCWDYNYTQSIYLAGELVSAGAVAGSPGYIYSIQYYQGTYATPDNWQDWTIYMGNTTMSSFTTTTSWLPASGLTNVFSGTVTPSGTGWYTITLTTPFYWDGTSNIVVAVDENTPGYACTAQWQCTVTGIAPDYRSISYYSDDINPDPAAPPVAGARGLLFPNIKLDFRLPTPCTGAPAGGNAMAAAADLCPGGTTRLSVSGSTAATGLTMQWETAAAASGPWTAITGATAAILDVNPAACADHYYRRVLTCTASGISVPSAAVKVSVSCALTPPYLETFEAITTANQFPSCMTATNAGTATYTYLVTPGTYNRSNHTAGGTKFAAFGYGADDYMFTPPVQVLAGKTYEFSFWYVTDGTASWKTLEAKVGDAAAASAMTASLGAMSTVNNVLYQQFKATYTPTVSGTRYFGIYCNAGTGPWYLSVDDISINELPPCSGVPVAGTASATPSRICSSGSPVLQLSGTSAVTGLLYRWESSMTGTPGSFGPIAGGTSPVFKAPSISSGTYYRAVVKCSFSGDSAVSSVVYVAAGSYDPPYREDFESITMPNQLPVCMSATSIAPYVYTYMLATGSYKQTNHTPGGNRFASFRYGSNDYLFTPAINLVAGRTYEFSFWYVTDGLPGWNTLSASYGYAPGKAGMTIPLGTAVTAPANTTYQQFKARFVATTTGVAYAGIFCNGTTSPWYLTIDDIQLQELPSCSGMPVAGTAAASPVRVCGTGTTTLDLPGLTAAVGFTYKWQDSAAGGSWGTGPGRPSFGGFTTPFVTGSVAATTYFRCIVTCSATGDSTVSAAVKVTAGGITPPYLQDFESITAVNQLPECMSATRINPYVYTSLAATGSYNRFNHTPGGSKFASFRYESNDYLFTPALNLRSGYRYAFSFWYITDGLSGWNTLRAAIGTDATATAMTMPLKTVTSPDNTAYFRYTDTFTVGTSGTYYGGIYCNGTTGPWYLTVDDISLQPVSCSGMPDAGTIKGAVPSGVGLCAGSRVTLRDSGATAQFVPGIAYQWQRRSIGSTGIWFNILRAVDTVYSADTIAGWEYRFAVTCINSSMVSYSPTFTLPVLPPHPPVSISGGADTLRFCAGDSLFLDATAYPDAVYTWMLEGKAIPGWKTARLGTTDPGRYTVAVSSPASSCTAVAPVLYLEGKNPGFGAGIIVPSDSIVCEGDSVVLKAMYGSLKWQWRKNNIDIPGADGMTYAVRNTGLYRITSFNDTAVCKAISRNVYILVSPMPKAVIVSDNPSNTACADKGLTLKTSADNTFLYQWSRNGSPVFGAVDSSLMVKNSGIYTVKIRNASNCVATSEELAIKILPSPDPVITRSGYILSVTGTYSNYQWYRNGIAITGETADTLLLTHNGMFTVAVTDENGCKGTSMPLEIYIPGLSVTADPVLAAAIRIYPNPSADRLFIEAPVRVLVTVKDITGRTVLEKQQAAEIDVSAWADGVYLFTLTDESGHFLETQRIHKYTAR